MSESARLGLPLLQPGQAQKDLTHNEALALLDIAVQASVVAVGTNVPPADPMPGTCWIVGSAPVGAWAGQAWAIAGWTAGGWRFVAPRLGYEAWCEAQSVSFRHDGTIWQVAEIAGSRVVIDGNVVLRGRLGPIADSTGGSVVDVEARATIAALLGALRGHGLIAP